MEDVPFKLNDAVIFKHSIAIDAMNESPVYALGWFPKNGNPEGWEWQYFRMHNVTDEAALWPILQNAFKRWFELPFHSGFWKLEKQENSTQQETVSTIHVSSLVNFMLFPSEETRQLTTFNTDVMGIPDKVMQMWLLDSSVTDPPIEHPNRWEWYSKFLMHYLFRGKANAYMYVHALQPLPYEMRNSFRSLFPDWQLKYEEYKYPSSKLAVVDSSKSKLGMYFASPLIGETNIDEVEDTLRCFKHALYDSFHNVPMFGYRIMPVSVLVEFDQRSPVKKGLGIEALFGPTIRWVSEITLARLIVQKKMLSEEDQEFVMSMMKVPTSKQSPILDTCPPSIRKMFEELLVN